MSGIAQLGKGMLGLVQQQPVDRIKQRKAIRSLLLEKEKGMPLLLAAVLLHEYILKTCLPRYKLKAEALEAANHLVESFFRTMAQEELNRNDTVSLIWDTI